MLDLPRDPVTGDRRSRPRFPVRWRARCNTHQRVWQGCLRDVHAGGGFFEVPEEEAGSVWRSLRTGHEILVRYAVEPFLKWVTVRAVVRWVGPSIEHGCAGVGFEFTGPRPRGACGLPIGD